ncbi:hypothetical protein UP09_07615 [Bradyrhizobium sp. LTSP885]|nr:hypothetical protein UP09_07615 [Bradyrhizobium sp. LTSP885]
MKTANQFQRMTYALLLFEEFELQFILKAVFVKAIVVVVEASAGQKGDVEAVASSGLVDRIRTQKFVCNEGIKMHTELVADDVGFMSSHGYAAKPFFANVVVAFAYLHRVARTALSEICEVMKQTNIKGGLYSWYSPDAIVV